MPRVARKYLCGHFFHAMVQGINREYIFDSDKDKDKYKLIILENYRKFDSSEFTILSYCIMDNHTHFLLFCKDFSLVSNFMHKINSAYSKYYNKSFNRVGYVFRDRFNVQTIQDERHLFKCIKYIHNNPVKAGLCNAMCEYTYSSYNEFLRKERNNKR